MSERVALLIGAPDDRLHGVEGDLDRMEEALACHSFRSERLLGPDATRAGILRALSALASEAPPGGAVVIYYSGHGGQIVNPRAGRGGRLREPSHFRCLIPTDIRASTQTNFRGILSVELDAHLAKIADRSANITIILDCCHSGGIVRDTPAESLLLTPPSDPDGRAYIMGAPWYEPISALRESLYRAGIDPDALAPEADPRVLRLTACGPHEIAIEARDARGCAGLFTMHLAELLKAQSGRPTTWLALARRVRQQVSARRQRQHPTLKGPGERLLFSLTEIPSRRALPIAGPPLHPRLGGGAMAGAEVGDRFLLMPLSEGDAPIGEARITRADASSATLEVMVEGRRVEPPPVAWASALPSVYARPRGAVELRTSPEIEALLHLALPSSGIAAPLGEDRTKAVAVIAEGDGTLEIRHPSDGARLRPPLALRSFGADHLDAVLRYIGEVVELLALRRALANLAPSPAQTLDRELASWSLMTTRDGNMATPEGYTDESPLRLGADSRVTVTLRNTYGRAEAIYGWIFWVCSSGHVELLSQRQPWGASVSGNELYVLGERPGAHDRGVELRSSGVLPAGGHRGGDLVLIAADGQADLRSWERSARPFRKVDPLRPPTNTRAGSPDVHEPLPGHARRFAVWRVPVEPGRGAPP